MESTYQRIARIPILHATAMVVDVDWVAKVVMVKAYNLVIVIQTVNFWLTKS